MSKTEVVERHPHPKFKRLSVQLRTDSRFYQAVSYLDGKLRQSSTKTTHLPTALKLAEDWYRRELRASVALGNQHPLDRITSNPTIAEVFKSYRRDLTPEQQDRVDERWFPIQDYWRGRELNTISSNTFKEFFVWRRKKNGDLKNGTVHKDVVLIRQILKHAIDNEQIEALPHIPSVGKIAANPRPWFTPEEWQHLLEVAEDRIEKAPSVTVRQKRQDLLDMIVFLHAGMMRVDELRALRFNNCTADSNEQRDDILKMEVTGKRGTRTAIADERAMEIIVRRAKGRKLGDLIFPHHCRDAFRELLIEAGLREYRGFQRNLKSVRCTAISMKILANPNLNLAVIARNAGTSIAMIDAFYAARLSAEMAKNELTRKKRPIPSHWLPV
jgi:integrase